uniref:RING-type domain-containing protein n=1 Tax=Branchiostoma floridae TaxID=7739 RepID=C3ZXX3_BRAFL|eukprot:XP_002586581.1 hypothetical protein BRAFLDRAFT_106176 [Branchiostoma floridae]
MAPRRTRSTNTSSGVRGHPYRSGGTRTSVARVRGQSNRSQVTRTTTVSADQGRGQTRTRAQRSVESNHSSEPRGQRSRARVHSADPRGQRSGRNAISRDSASPTTGENTAFSAAQSSVHAQSGNDANSSARRSSRVRADATTNDRRRGSGNPPAATRRSSRLQGIEGMLSSPFQSHQPVPNDATRSHSPGTNERVLRSSGTVDSNIPTGGPPPQVAQQGDNSGIQEQGNQQNGNVPTPTPLLSTGRFSAYYVGRANHFYSDLLSLTPQPTRDRGNSGYNLRRRWATQSSTDRGGTNQPRGVPPRPVERAPEPPVSSQPPSRLREGPVTRSQARLRQSSQGTVWRQGRFRIRHPGPVEPGHEEDSMQHAMDMLTDLSSPNNTRDEDTMSESSNGSDRSGIPGEALPENFLGFGPEFWQGRRLVSIRFVRDHSILDYFPATGNMYISSLDEPPRGLSPQEIESIPYRNFARNEEAKTCSICIVNYRTGNRVKTLPCSHEFHEACIKRWLREHENCPTCRQPVREADSTAAEDTGAAAEAGAPPENDPAPSGEPPNGVSICLTILFILFTNRLWSTTEKFPLRAGTVLSPPLDFLAKDRQEGSSTLSTGLDRKRTATASVLNTTDRRKDASDRPNREENNIGADRGVPANNAKYHDNILTAAHLQDGGQGLAPLPLRRLYRDPRTVLSGLTQGTSHCLRSSFKFIRHWNSSSAACREMRRKIIRRAQHAVWEQAIVLMGRMCEMV